MAIRVKLDRPPEALLRAAVVALLLQDMRKSAVTNAAIWIDLDHPPEAFPRAVMVALLLLDIPKKAICGSRISPDRTPIALLRVLEVAISLENTAKANASMTILKLGTIRTKLDCSPEALLSVFEVAIVFEVAPEQKVCFSVLFPPERFLFLRSSTESFFLSPFWIPSRIG